MSKFIVGTSSDRLFEALAKHGLVKEDARDVSRIVIDLKVGRPGMIYIAKFADDSIADVLLNAGIAELES